VSGYLKNFWDDFNRNQALVLFVVKPLGKQHCIARDAQQFLVSIRTTDSSTADGLAAGGLGFLKSFASSS